MGASNSADATTQYATPPCSVRLPVGDQVPGDKHAHFTAAFVGRLTPERLHGLQQRMKQMPLPVSFTCTDVERWPTKNNAFVTVKKCVCDSAQFESEVKQLMAEYGQRDPNLPENKKTPTEPLWHVTLKYPEGTQKAVVDSKITPTARTLEIKPLGPVDPIFATSGISHALYARQMYCRNLLNMSEYDKNERSDDHMFRICVSVSDMK